MDKEDVVIHTMEYYMTIQNNEMTPLAVTWMNLEPVSLRRVRDKYHMILLNVDPSPLWPPPLTP